MQLSSILSEEPRIGFQYWIGSSPSPTPGVNWQALISKAKWIKLGGSNKYPSNFRGLNKSVLISLFLPALLRDN